MKAVFYDEFGGPEVLQIGERPMPTPGAGQVLVKVAAAGVNPIDRRLRNGELQNYFERSWPLTPGWDFAGEIVDLGNGVSGWSKGDHVVGLAFTWSLHFGTYAEYVPVNIDAIGRLPENLSFVEGAALPLVSLTAWQALHEFADVRKGQTVLIQAAAGGVGSVAVPMAKHLGAKVYATCRTQNFAYVSYRGADVPIDYTQENYFTTIKDKEPHGIDVVLETLTGDEVVENAIRLVKPGGAVPFMNNEPPDMPEIRQNNIRSEFIHHRPDGKMLSDLMALYQDGRLPLPEIATMPLEQAQEAHRKSEGGSTRGKLVLTIAHGA